MRDIVKEWIGIASLLIVVAIGCSLLAPFLREMSEPIVSDYEDKTTLKASGSIITDGKIQTGADLYFAIANTDINVPYPRAITINGDSNHIFKLDTSFQANVNKNLAILYSPSGDYKLGSKLDYRVTNIEFVKDDVKGDHWDFTLEP